MSFAYRPYQVEAQQAVRLAWESGIEGGLHPMIVLPTGCGKTATALDFAAETLQNGGRVVWGAHRTELLTQPLKAFCRAWPELGKYAGIVQGSRDDASCRFVAASFDTLRNKKRLERLLSFGPIDLLIVDEGHHAAAETYLRVIRAMKAGRMVGLTATPHRDDGKALEEVWDIVYSYPVTEAIASGFLVPPYSMVLPIPGVDAKILAIADDEAQGDALIAAHVVEHTVAAIQGSGLAVGLPAREDSRFFDASKRRYFLFSASVKQAELTAAALREAGIAAAAASGETPADVRAGMLADLTKGRITVLCSPMIFTEGTDCPAVDGVVIARSCSGWATYVQCVGRGLRPNPDTGKRDCLILDFSGASEAHDLRSAPVLIGGSKCPNAANGVHVFEEDKRGRAVCRVCEKTLPCFAAKGPHAWGVDHICRACGKPQCEGTTDHAHSWIRAVDVQICTACGAETKIRTAMVPKLSAKPTDTAFVRIPNLAQEFWAFRAGESGTVAVECDRSTKKGRAFWFVERGRVGRAITPGWVDFGLIRAYLEDIAKRAEKLIRPDAEWRQRPLSRNMMNTLDFHGIRPTGRWNMGQAFDAVARVTIREKLIKAGLAHEGREARHDSPPAIVPGKESADAE